MEKTNHYFDKFRVSFDQSFEEVMDKCKSKKRPDQEGTWITPELKSSFLELHRRGFAHSVEVWHEDKLVGGLYGLALGQIFFGESMFADVSNASKFGFIKLVQFLQKKDFKLIDCQQETRHLKSLGAETVSKFTFYKYLKENIFAPHLKGTWSPNNL